MGKIGLKPCGRHHRWWCRGKRRCCPRSLWCLWFPCTSPEEKEASTTSAENSQTSAAAEEMTKTRRRSFMVATRQCLPNWGLRLHFILLPSWIGRHPPHAEDCKIGISWISFLLSFTSWFKCAGFVKQAPENIWITYIVNIHLGGIHPGVYFNKFDWAATHLTVRHWSPSDF